MYIVYCFHFFLTCHNFSVWDIGMGHSDQDICLHKSHSLTRGLGKVVMRDVGQNSTSSLSYHIRDKLKVFKGKI